MQEIERKTRGTGVLVIVLVLVNGIAIWGQAGWAHEHVVPQMIPGDLPGIRIVGWVTALLLAAALELTGVYLSIMADEAERRGQPSGGLRLMAYSCGLLSGVLNFSHWEGTAAKISLGFLSTISPFLWGVFSRVRRGETIAPSRRFWHPIESIKLVREMAWEGIASEEEAISRRSAEKELLRLTEKVESREREMEEALGAEMLAEAEISPKVIEEIREHFPSALELENVRSISPSPVSPAGPRPPRVSGDVEKAIEMLAGDAPKSEILSVSSVSPTTYGRLAKVFRTVRADRGAQIDYRAEKVRPEHVEMMRRALAR